MKTFLRLVAAVAFVSTALIVQAATPKAAEDASGDVTVTNTPAPTVKKTAPAKNTPPAKSASQGGSKQQATKTPTAKKKKLRPHRHVATR